MDVDVDQAGNDEVVAAVDFDGGARYRSVSLAGCRDLAVGDDDLIEELELKALRVEGSNVRQNVILVSHILGTSLWSSGRFRREAGGD